MNSYSSQFKMDVSISIMIILLKSDKGFSLGKENMSWIFIYIQNPMKMDLEQYKVFQILFYSSEY